jgi:hypothetical protein
MGTKLPASWLAAAAAAAAASVLTVAGCSAPAAGTPAPHRPSGSSAPSGRATVTDAASAPGARPKGGPVHVLGYSINSDGPYLRVLVTGAVGDYGQGVAVYPDGKVDPEHNSELSLKLRYGSFRLKIARLDKEIVTAYRHWQSNPATCSGNMGVTAPAPVVPGSGTGRYRGITGSVTMTATIDEVDKKPVCNGTSAFLSQYIFMIGSGRVSFG